jgi:hypothetical protein
VFALALASAFLSDQVRASADLVSTPLASTFASVLCTLAGQLENALTCRMGVRADELSRFVRAHQAQSTSSAAPDTGAGSPIETEINSRPEAAGNALPTSKSTETSVADSEEIDAVIAETFRKEFMVSKI